MKSPQKTAVCVRTPDGEISTDYMDEKDLKDKYKIFALPFIRGLGAFIDSMKIGYKALMLSAEKSGLDAEEEDEDSEPSKFEQWISDKLGDKIMNILMVISTVLGIGLAIVLFFVLPTFLYNLTGAQAQNTILRSVCEGVMRVAIFLVYLTICSNAPYIKRVFQYHGAEHKTIFCYEAKKELTVENVKEFKRFHPRCGTSFIVISLLIGIIAGFFIPISAPVLRTVVKLLCLPIVLGISYEAIRICGKYDNTFTKIISAPGLWIQRLTTKEPEDDMIEVAIQALNAVSDGEQNNCCGKTQDDTQTTTNSEDIK